MCSLGKIYSHVNLQVSRAHPGGSTHPDPYPYYAALVAGLALVFDAPRGLWIASSAAAVRAVLGNAACQVRPLTEPVPQALLGCAAGEVFGHLVRMNDGALHTAPKLALQRFLAALDLEHISARTQALALEAAKRQPLHGCALTRWTLDVPVMAVADLPGVDEASVPRLAGWMADFVACLSPLSTQTELAAASLAANALLERFAELLRSSALRPGSAVEKLRFEAAQVGWTDARALLCNLIGLLSQTCEATAGVIGNSLTALATQPGLRETVARDPGRLLPLVREVSRHDSSIYNTHRFVVEDTRVAGLRLQAGDAIVLVLTAASRDPLHHPRPEIFA